MNGNLLSFWIKLAVVFLLLIFYFVDFPINYWRLVNIIALKNSSDYIAIVETVRKYFINQMIFFIIGMYVN